MSKLKHSYYLVAGHLDEDYFEKVTDDPIKRSSFKRSVIRVEIMTGFKANLALTKKDLN